LHRSWQTQAFFRSALTQRGYSYRGADGLLQSTGSLADFLTTVYPERPVTLDFYPYSSTHDPDGDGWYRYKLSDGESPYVGTGSGDTGGGIYSLLGAWLVASASVTWAPGCRTRI
jgi:hypothetical protein